MPRSSTESKYRVMTQNCCEIVWVQGLLFDLKIDTLTPVDSNKAAI